MRLDSHQHFWRYSESEFPWIAVGSPLHRDYVPDDLLPLLGQSGIDGCIAVQARQNLEENRFLCDLASNYDWIRGVVGWIDLRSVDVSRQAEEFSQMPKAVGVRHVVQDEVDPHFMAGEAFRRGIQCLKSFDLVYDILIYSHQLSDAILLVRDCPEQMFVVDHLAKPRIREGEIDQWTKGMRELSRYENVVVKLSGIVTEAHWSNWTSDDLCPYWDMVAESFGANRLLFGSDWPVIRLASEYQRWVEIVQDWLSSWTVSERESVWGGNAERVYLTKR